MDVDIYVDVHGKTRLDRAYYNNMVLITCEEHTNLCVLYLSKTMSRQRDIYIYIYPYVSMAYAYNNNNNNPTTTTTPLSASHEKSYETIEVHKKLQQKIIAVNSTTTMTPINSSYTSAV